MVSLSFSMASGENMYVCECVCMSVCMCMCMSVCVGGSEHRGDMSQALAVSPTELKLEEQPGGHIWTREPREGRKQAPSRPEGIVTTPGADLRPPSPKREHSLPHCPAIPRLTSSVWEGLFSQSNSTACPSAPAHSCPPRSPSSRV